MCFSAGPTYWPGTGSTNTDLDYLGEHCYVYSFNTNNTYDYWELINVGVYSYTNINYSIINSNEISNLYVYWMDWTINYLAFVTMAQEVTDDSNRINWTTWQTGFHTYSPFFSSNYIYITNRFIEVSNFIVSNVISNYITNNGLTNFTGTANFNQPVFYEFRKSTNLYLPK